MRYAIISDIHANEAALRAVLTDAVDARADKIICLGDVLGYGPDPVAALELVYRRAHVCLAGNHDDAVSRRFPVEDFTDSPRRPSHATAPRCRRRRSTGTGACPTPASSTASPACTVTSPIPSTSTTSLSRRTPSHPGTSVPNSCCSSGTPTSPASSSLAQAASRICWRAWTSRWRTASATSSTRVVGYPRSGACRSSYCIYDDQSRTVFFRTLPFDLDSYATKMHGQGLNEAPWMLARAAERRRPAVRGNAKVGRAGATGV